MDINKRMISKENVRNFFNTYGVATFIGIASIGLTWAFLPITGDNFFAFNFLAIVIAAYLRGIRAGIFSIILITLGSYYFFFFPNNSSSSFAVFLVRTVIFIIAGYITCLLIDKLANTNESAAFKKREKENLALIEKLQAEKIKDKKEIQARDEFLSIASHELKTPLSAMLLQLQTALHNIKSVSLANFSVAKLMKMLESTEQQSLRLSRMISDLLNVSLITTGKLSLEKEEIDIAKLTKDVADRFSEKIKHDGYKIKLDIKGPINGYWDKLRIEQAISNLLANAIKYGEGKPIEIRTEKRRSNAYITVIDQGIGIPTDEKERIFERFERGNANGHKGLGVGLYITSQIIKAHRGNIKIQSREGAGSTFTIELPITKKPRGK